MSEGIDKPTWLANFKPVPMTDTKFQPGQSGNPKGRAPGTKTKKTLAMEALETSGPEVAAKVVELAKAGDMQAAALVLTRIVPVMRARAEKVEFQLDPTAPLTQQAQQILGAIAGGKLDPETAKVVLDCLGTYAAIRQADEYEARLIALEQQVHATATAHETRALGGVLQVVHP